MTVINPKNRMKQLTKGLALALLLVGLSAGPARAQQDDQEYKREYNAGIESAKAKQYDEAYTHFVKAADLAKKAKDAEIADRASKVAAQIDYNMGKKLSEAEKYEEALKRFDKGLQLYPGYAMNHLGRGYALKKMDRTDDAMTAFQAAMKSDDREAVAAAEKAIRDDFLYRASTALTRNGENATRRDAEEALANLEKPEEYGLQPDSDTYYYRAEAQKVLGNYDAAVAAADKALELHTGSKSDKAKIYFVKGESLMLKGSVAEAKSAFQEARYGSFKAPAEHYIETL